MAIRFSLIVPTMNRRAELALLFASLKAQDCQDFELIIVDMNADPGLVAGLLDSAGLTVPVRVLATPRCGASEARNHGLPAARGGIITFPDDDCEYSPGVLSRVSAHFAAGGVDVLAVNSRARHTPGGMGRMLKRSTAIGAGNLFATIIEYTVFYDRRIVPPQLFDPGLGVGSPSGFWSDEGPDAVLACLRRGARARYVADIFIYHPDPVLRLGPRQYERSFRYGMGRGAFIRKNGLPKTLLFLSWAKYAAGIILSLVRLDPQRLKYYALGLRGRIGGFFTYRRS